MQVGVWVPSRSGSAEKLGAWRMVKSGSNASAPAYPCGARNIVPAHGFGDDTNRALGGGVRPDHAVLNEEILAAVVRQEAAVELVEPPGLKRPVDRAPDRK